MWCMVYAMYRPFVKGASGTIWQPIYCADPMYIKCSVLYTSFASLLAALHFKKRQSCLDNQITQRSFRKYIYHLLSSRE